MTASKSALQQTGGVVIIFQHLLWRGIKNTKTCLRLGFQIHFTSETSEIDADNAAYVKRAFFF